MDYIWIFALGFAASFGLGFSSGWFLSWVSRKTVASTENEEPKFSKVCSSCGVMKPASEFYTHKTGFMGLRSRCIDCYNEIKNAARAEARKPQEDPAPVVETRTCKKCGESKDPSKFHKALSSPDGLHSWCIKCRKQYDADRHAKSREKKAKKIREAAAKADTETGTKRCPKCGETKSVKEFCKNRSSSDGLQTYCSACFRAFRSKKETAEPMVLNHGLKTCIRCDKEKGAESFNVGKTTCRSCESLARFHKWCIDHGTKWSRYGAAGYQLSVAKAADSRTRLIAYKPNGTWGFEIQVDSEAVHLEHGKKSQDLAKRAAQRYYTLNVK